MVRVGLVGTSWWADSMYLPALADHRDGTITAVCGRNPDNARELAARWGVAEVYTDPAEMIEHVDAVIVASSNATHHPISMAAIAAGRALLCEKPLGLDATQADELARAAAEAGVTTMTPFTYRFMPLVRELHHRIESGFIGTPYHMAARYYTGYARDGAYHWRFDRAESGSGVLGDLGTHWVDLALYLLGPITAVSAITNATVPRAPRPDGSDYAAGEDAAFMTVCFASGAIGQLTVSAVCWEGTAFNQTHHIEVHGSAGTLYSINDWDTTQEIRAVTDPGTPRMLERTPGIWDGLRTDTVHNTYRDVFRTTDAMTRGWVSAIARSEPVQPDLAHGALVQRIIDRALQSAALGGTMLPID